MTPIEMYEMLREEAASEGIRDITPWENLQPSYQITFGKFYRRIQREPVVWRCFHCDETFANPHLARAHFGNGPEDKPACILIQERGMLYELREAQQKVTALTAKVEQLEYQVNGQEAAIASRFKGVRSVDAAWQMYDSMEGRALAAEKALAVIDTHGYVTIWKDGDGDWNVLRERGEEPHFIDSSLILAIIKSEKK